MCTGAEAGFIGSPLAFRRSTAALAKPVNGNVTRQYACCAKSRLRLPGWRTAGGVISSR